MEIESSGGDFVQTTVRVHKSALSSAQPHIQAVDRQSLSVAFIYVLLLICAHQNGPLSLR